jgi:uroporphyrinogen decarboxylase
LRNPVLTAYFTALVAAFHSVPLQHHHHHKIQELSKDMGKDNQRKTMLAVLQGETVRPPPVWLMRQAGRYLPEYQAVRARAGSFWAMCMNPDLAVEVTLQPIRRFDFDAAILFSDILVIPHALGQEVRFEEGLGPVLGSCPEISRLERDSAVWARKLEPVYEAMRGTRAKLAVDKTLIGFAGAPWTLAAYMLEGRGSPDQRAAKLAAYREPKKFATLLGELSKAVAWHLGKQLEAGADTVQIFDSWAGGLPVQAFEDFVVQPNKEVVRLLRQQFPAARIIGFPRAASESGYRRYAAETGVDAVSIDTATSLQWAIGSLPGTTAIQGNLDPIVLIAGGDALDQAVDRILQVTRDRAFIFNLGHGVLPETPTANVERLVARIRGAT